MQVSPADPEILMTAAPNQSLESTTGRLENYKSEIRKWKRKLGATSGS